MKGLYNGAIQTVSYRPLQLFTLAQKEAGRGDFTKIPGGLPGVETRGVLMYTFGVAAGKITKEKMAEVLSENPAKLYGAYPRKGAILPGSDADIVVYDPDADTTVCAADMISAAEYTPYEGMRTSGSDCAGLSARAAGGGPRRGAHGRNRHVYSPEDRVPVSDSLKHPSGSFSKGAFSLPPRPAEKPTVFPRSVDVQLLRHKRHVADDIRAFVDAQRAGVEAQIVVLSASPPVCCWCSACSRPCACCLFLQTLLRACLPRRDG